MSSVSFSFSRYMYTFTRMSAWFFVQVFIKPMHSSLGKKSQRKVNSDMSDQKKTAFHVTFSPSFMHSFQVDCVAAAP